MAIRGAMVCSSPCMLMLVTVLVSVALSSKYTAPHVMVTAQFQDKTNDITQLNSDSNANPGGGDSEEENDDDDELSDVFTQLDDAVAIADEQNQHQDTAQQGDQKQQQQKRQGSQEGHNASPAGKPHKNKAPPAGGALRSGAQTLCGLSLRLLSGTETERSDDEQLGQLLMHTSRLCTHLADTHTGNPTDQHTNGPLNMFVAGVTAFCTQVNSIAVHEAEFTDEDTRLWRLSKTVCDHRPRPSRTEPPTRHLTRTEVASFCKDISNLLLGRTKRELGGKITSYGVLLMHSAAMCSYVPMTPPTHAPQQKPDTGIGAEVKMAADQFCTFVPRVLVGQNKKYRDNRFLKLAMKASAFCTYDRRGQAPTPPTKSSLQR
ncbi:uncharacterized protein LOC135809119 [Sycon ciliatum]|uniref:uncharacterized protein LOC135809119 n=1 Tax=Sycon ciliatum TaxID=27933 RepID=UPI0031F710CC